MDTTTMPVNGRNASPTGHAPEGSGVGTRGRWRAHLERLGRLVTVGSRTSRPAAPVAARRPEPDPPSTPDTRPAGAPTPQTAPNPAAPPASGPAGSAHARPTAPLADSREPGCRPALDVLLVEDDAGDVALVSDFFAFYQIPGRLHVVNDGVEALRFLQRVDGYVRAPRPDLILLDLNMPRMDGRQLLATIKADDSLSSIPAVVFTTSAAADDINHSYAAHANAYVTKPLDVDDFQRVVDEIHRFYSDVASRPDLTTRRGSAGDPDPAGSGPPNSPGADGS